MCTAFWNLDIADFPCPECGERSEWNFQTHYRGEAGSCVFHHRLGDPIEDLAGVTTILAGARGPHEEEWLTTSCPRCKANFRFGAHIRNGAVHDVFQLMKEPA
jgi:endogenous inhibitor of DNA gyrase (YacG/DUF329 family)